MGRTVAYGGSIEVSWLAAGAEGSEVVEQSAGAFLASFGGVQTVEVHALFLRRCRRPAPAAKRRHRVFGLLGQMIEQEMKCNRGEPVAAVVREHVVADVHLADLQPGTVGVVVDPTDNLACDLDAECRHGIIHPVAEESPRLDVPTVDGQVEQRYGSSPRRAAGNDLGMPQPVIIEVAINGSTTRAVNPNVPKSPDEIAAESLRCIEAGASIIHAHCDPVGGPDEEVAERYLGGFGPVLAQRPDALLYPTVNFGAGGMSFGHLPILAAAGLRIGLLDPGSLNLGRLGDDGLPTGTFVYANSFDRIRDVFELHRAHALGPSLAIYEPGFLRTALAYWRAGQLPAGTMIKLYLAEEQGLLGAPFGLPVSRAGLDAYLDILGDCDVPWAVSAVGGDIVRNDVGRNALERGGHLHIGLEFYGGDRTPTNLELVEEAVALCAELGRPTATCTEAAEILALPTAGQRVTSVRHDW